MVKRDVQKNSKIPKTYPCTEGNLLRDENLRTILPSIHKVLNPEGRQVGASKRPCYLALLRN
jgi:hypothetical protein